MKRFSKAQFDRFDEGVYRALNQLDPVRFVVSRERIGDAVTYQVLDIIDGLLSLKFILSWNPDGTVKRGLWVHPNYQGDHDRMADTLMNAMTGALPRFEALIEEPDFQNPFGTVHAIFLGDLPDAINFVRRIASGSTGGRIKVTERMFDEGEGMALLGLSTDEQYENWSTESELAHPPDVVGGAIVQRLNSQRSGIAILILTRLLGQYTQNIVENMSLSGVTENVRVGTQKLTWWEADSDVNADSTYSLHGSQLPGRDSAHSVNQFKDLADLNRKIASSFSLSEIKDLCLEIGVNHEEIEGGTPSVKARELTAYASRHGTLDELIALCQRERPNLLWNE